MNDEFNKRINELEREILSLKTSSVKSTAMLSTTSQSFTYTFPLKAGATTPSGELISAVSNFLFLKLSSGTYSLNTITLDSGTLDEDVFVYPVRMLDGADAVYRFECSSTKASDLSTIQAGGSVSYTYKFKITSTSQFTLSHWEKEYNV